mgnify:CR=1 FL=1
MARPHHDHYELTEAEKRDLIRLIEQARRDGLIDVQRQDVTVGRVDFFANHDVQPMACRQVAGSQATVYSIMVGDGNDVEIGATQHMLDHLAWGRPAIAQTSVNVQVGLAPRPCGVQ